VQLWNVPGILTADPARAGRAADPPTAGRQKLAHYGQGAAPRPHPIADTRTVLACDVRALRPSGHRISRRRALRRSGQSDCDRAQQSSRPADAGVHGSGAHVAAVDAQRLSVSTIFQASWKSIDSRFPSQADRASPRPRGVQERSRPASWTA
jgi:hypothetical protein